LQKKLRKLFLAHTFALSNVRNKQTASEEMSDFSNNVPCEPDERCFFPKVTTSVEQRDFVYGELLKRLKDEGQVEHENWSEFTRVAIEELAKKVGLSPVVMKKKSAGRKPGKKRF
jgi:hypothetical protein